MSDEDVRQKISKLFANVAGSGNQDSFEQLLEVMRVHLRNEVEAAHAAYMAAPSGSSSET